MFKAFNRSWEITKLSFSVINQDREMLLFPILGSIFSFIFLIVMAVPSLLPAIMDSAGFSEASMIVYAPIMFIIYLGLAFIATFFNCCVVYTTKTRFEGGDATFMESLKFSISKIHLIFAWSLVAAIVGTLLRLLDMFAERLGPIGAIIVNFITSIIGLIWSVLTIFVVPSMVYNDSGPLEAIKDSTYVIKKTWGESLIRHYGLGMIQFIMIFAGIIVLVPIGMGCYAVSTTFGAGALGMAPVVIIGAVYFVIVGFTFAVANSVFNTALYVYAHSGIVPEGYTHDILINAFKHKKK